MTHWTWWKGINLISATLCYFSLKQFLKMTIKLISPTDNFITFRKHLKHFNLFLCSVLAESLCFFVLISSSMWAAISLFNYTLPSAWISCCRRSDTKTDHHKRDKLLLCFVKTKSRRIVVSTCVQDDVTLLSSANHYPSISSNRLFSSQEQQRFFFCFLFFSKWRLFEKKE